MDIICDKKIPTRSDEAMEAKMNAKEILTALQEEAQETNQKLMKITEAIGLVRTCRVSFQQSIAIRLLTNNSALLVQITDGKRRSSAENPETYT